MARRPKKDRCYLKDWAKISGIQEIQCDGRLGEVGFKGVEYRIYFQISALHGVM